MRAGRHRGGGGGKEAALKPALPPEDWQGAAPSFRRCSLLLPPLPEVAAHLLKDGKTESKGPLPEPGGFLLQLLGGRAAGTAPLAMPTEPSQAAGRLGMFSRGVRLHGDSTNVPCTPCSRCYS